MLIPGRPERPGDEDQLHWLPDDMIDARFGPPFRAPISDCVVDIRGPDCDEQSRQTPRGALAETWDEQNEPT